MLHGLWPSHTLNSLPLYKIAKAETWFSRWENDQTIESTLHKQEPSDHGHDLRNFGLPVGNVDMRYFSLELKISDFMPVLELVALIL